MATITRQFRSRQNVFVVLVGVAVFSCFSSGTIAKSFSAAAITRSSPPSASTEPPSPAPLDILTGGSFLVSDLNQTLLNQPTELRAEVDRALTGVDEYEVGCYAPIIFLASSDLHHSRVAPFSCSFPDGKSLTIEAENFAKLPGGELVPLDQLLDRGEIPQGTSLQFNLTSWQWTDSKH